MRARVFHRTLAATGGLLVLMGVTGPGVAEAAPGGDAVIAAKNFTLDTSGATPAGSATVMCPTGTRATGGGVGPTAPVDGDNYRVQASGPVDSSGLSVNTDSGDIPRGWLVTVSLFSGPPSADFRAFALCSRDSDAVVQAVPGTGSATWTGLVQCPTGMRALSGGALPLSPVPDGEQDYIFHESNPVDSTASTSGTTTGDVAVGWRTVVDTNGGGSGAPRFFAVCSAKSDATVRAADLTVPASQTASTTVSCPSGRRVVGGGMGVDAADVNDRVEYIAPIGPAGTIAGTKTGDIAKQWTASGRNTSSTTERVYRVMVLCAGSERRPDALIKRSTESKYVGNDIYLPTSQVRAWSARRGQTRSFNLRFQNDGDTDSFAITGCHSRTTYKISYINPSNGSDVTAKVTSTAGFVFSGLAHKAVRNLVLRVRPTSAASIGSVPACRVVAKSRTVTSVRDAVTAKVKVVR
jgi:hypothetical protein